MALAKEDLQAIQSLLEPINTRFDKIESRFDQVDSRFDKIELRIDKIDSRIDKIEQGQLDLKESLQVVRSSQMKVELEQYPRIAAALDGVVGGNEKNEEQDRRIFILENKSENQGNRISALEYAFKAK